MQIIFDSKEEADIFRFELFNIQTNFAKIENKTNESSVLFIEKLYYLSNTDYPINNK